MRVVVAESALPTSQCYPEFFLVDMNVTQGNAIIETMLPRLNGMAIFGVLFNATHMSPSKRFAFTASFVFFTSYGVGLAVLADHSLDGEDLSNFVYFGYPILCMVATLIMFVAAMIMQYNTRLPPAWAEEIGVTAHTVSEYQTLLLRIQPQLMVQVALIIAQRESFSAVRVDNMLVFDWPTTEEPSTSDAVLIDLGLVPEDGEKQLFKKIPLEQIEAYKNHGRKAGICEASAVMTRRLGVKGRKASEMSAGGLAESLLI